MKKGFSLIELLVVISIIGLLATLVFANLNAARERGRDAQRKSDLRSVQTALRLYYNDNAAYPATGTLPTWGSAWTVGTTTYMSKLPKDPLSSQSYTYTRGADTDTYTLDACLENKSDTAGVSNPACPNGLLYRVTP